MNATDEWGTLSPGKRADILLVDGKPDRKISGTRKITLVMQQGAVIDRDRLKLDLHRDPDTNLLVSSWLVTGDSVMPKRQAKP